MFAIDFLHRSPFLVNEFITDTLITIFILPFHLLSSLAHRIEVRLTTPPSKAGEWKAATNYHDSFIVSYVDVPANVPILG